MALFDKLKKSTPDFDPKEVLPSILEALGKEGYRPEQDNDMRIVYKNEGIYFCLYYRTEDPEFLMVRATFERAAFDDVPEPTLYKACAATDYDQKVSKAYIDDEGDIVFSVETFLFPGTPIAKLALRMNDALGSTIAFFHRTLKDMTGKGESTEENASQPSGGELAN